MRFRQVAALLLATPLSACRVGPDHVTPQPEVAARFSAVSDEECAPVVEAWWGTFGDPVLRRCIEEALATNLDVRASLQRIRAARALRRIESSAYWPSVDASARFTKDRISENHPRFAPAIEQGLFDRDVASWDLGFDVGWEIDVFGGTERRVEGAIAELEALEFERGALMLSTAAEVARNYFELRGTQAVLRVLEEQVANEWARGVILEQQQLGGLLSSGPHLQSLSAQEKWRSAILGLQAEVRAGRYRLAVLMGRRPEDGLSELDGSVPLPACRGRVPTGLPSELLRRRPDVLAAERRIAAASADIGVATAEFFPEFSLTGSPFLQAEDFGDLFRSSSTGWLFGPSLSWSVFSVGRNRARVDAARAYHEQALLNYEGAVNRVLEEVESALTRYGKGLEALDALSRAAELERRRETIESVRSEAGITGTLAVHEVRSVALEAERQRIDKEVEVLVQLVGLYKALGGGWSEAERVARATAGDDRGEPGGEL